MSLPNFSHVTTKAGGVSLKVIFLDIDGVLHSFNYEQSLIKKGLSPFDNEGMVFDPKCIKALSALIEETNAEIVIHSSWKDCDDKGKALRIMRKIWFVRNLPGHILDVTPTLREEDMMRLYGIKATTCWRGYEIKTWLAQHPECDKYVIIDDQQLFLPEQLQLVVNTAGKNGLTMSNVRMAKKKLSMNPTTIRHTAGIWERLHNCLIGVSQAVYKR